MTSQQPHVFKVGEKVVTKKTGDTGQIQSIGPTGKVARVVFDNGRPPANIFLVALKPAAAMPKALQKTGASKAPRMFENAVGLSLALTRLGTRRKVRTERIQTDADNEMVHVSKDIIDSDAHRAIIQHDNALKLWLKERPCRPRSAWASTSCRSR